jgi:tetratricopeptide (TPR) repeat protein
MATPGARPRRAVVGLVLAVAVAVSSAAAGPAAEAEPTRATPAAEAPAAESRSADARATQSASDREIARWSARIARVPEDADALVALGEAFAQKARETADASYFSRAEAAFEKARALRPERPGALIGLAWVAGARHEFERSAEWARRALALEGTLASAHGLLGDAALEQGEYDEAAEHYQRMLDARPDLASYSRAAQLLFTTGDARKATWMMRKAIDAGAPYAENTAWARAQLALMLWQTGALVPAEQLLREALARTPDSAHLLAAMGKVAAARGDHRAAIEHLRRAVAAAPHHDTVVTLGDVLASSGRPEEAEGQYALVEAIAKLNRAAGVRGDLELARFRADRGQDLDWAVREAEAVYRTRRTVHAADTLAWCYYQSGRAEDARRLIARALGHRTPDARMLYHAGMIHAKLGDRAAAQTFLYQALSLNPRFHPREADVAAATLAELGSAR